jgi:hypothetical protein
MVSCYIDSLLFSMFARVDSFESMLCVEFPDPTTNNLAVLIRFWVNMLRTGKLITIDLVKHIQDALGECGWDEARLIRQQDVSEAFTFITDKLALPLLTLKMDVYHTGKESMDDHRYVRERLLDVAIPEEPLPDGTTLKLEDCLENFFNNKVEVKRMLQRRNTINSRPNDVKAQTASSVEKVEDVRRTSTAESVFRKRNMSLLGNTPSENKNTRDDIDISYGTKAKEVENAAVLRKEVLIPAWQFFHLIPWFQNKLTTEGRPTTDAQVAAHFAKRRPVLGICLKRYKHTADGPKRLDTYIDVPLEIRLPHFISDGTQDDGFGSSFSTFKLSLQSIVCHRGVSLNAGHYISVVRPATHEISTPEAEAERRYQWLMHDDLAKDSRITIVDVRKSLKIECPYLLFYQVQLIDEDEDYNYATRSSSEVDDPPSYAEATHKPNKSVDQPPTPTIVELGSSPGKSDETLIANISQLPSPAVNAANPELLSSTIVNGHLSPPRTPLLTPSEPKGSLELINSAPPHIEDGAVRAHSLDISSADMSIIPYSEGRKSHDSADKRSSVVFTEKSYDPSALTTPLEDPTGNKDGYLSVKDANTTQPSTPGSFSPNKRFSLRRGRQRDENKDEKKEKDVEKSEKRASRALWSTVGNKNPRPKSVPPIEGRTYLDYMKGFKVTLSKDKLPINTVGPDGEATTQEIVTPQTGLHDSPKLETGEIEGTPKGKKEGKELLVGLGIGRRKSLRARSKARRLSIVGTDEVKEGPERQCTLM